MGVQLYDGPTGPLTLPQQNIEAALERRRTLKLIDDAIHAAHLLEESTTVKRLESLKRLIEQ